MDEDDALIAIICSMIGYRIIFNKKRKKKVERKIWVKQWLCGRDVKGAYNALLSELSLTHREDYRRFMRMNHETFHVSCFLVVRTYQACHFRYNRRHAIILLEPRIIDE